MKPSRTSLVFGLAAAAISAVVSPALMIGLSGIGICGGVPLGVGLVGTAFLLASGLTALTGTLLRAFWPLGAVSFSWALVMSLVFCVALGAVEWARILTNVGCISISLLSAWVGSKIGEQVGPSNGG